MIETMDRWGRSIALLAALILALAAAILAGLLARTGEVAAAPNASVSGETLVYENEALLESEPATAPLVAQGNCCEVAWSGDAQLALLPRREAGRDTFTVAFDVPAGGSYYVSAFLTRAPDYGTYNLAIDGKRVGASFDGYGPVTLGGMGLRKGRHEITLTTTGKNPSATRYYAGLDSFVLTRR